MNIKMNALNQSQTMCAHAFTTILWTLLTLSTIDDSRTPSWLHPQCLLIALSSLQPRPAAQPFLTLRLFGLGHCLGCRAERKALPLYGISRDQSREISVSATIKWVSLPIIAMREPEKTRGIAGYNHDFLVGGFKHALKP